MPPVTIACDDCGEERVGKYDEEGVSAHRDDCPTCGSRHWEVVPELEYLLEDE